MTVLNPDATEEELLTVAVDTLADKVGMDIGSTLKKSGGKVLTKIKDTKVVNKALREVDNAGEIARRNRRKD